MPKAEGESSYASGFARSKEDFGTYRATLQDDGVLASAAVTASSSERVDATTSAPLQELETPLKAGVDDCKDNVSQAD